MAIVKLSDAQLTALQQWIDAVRPAMRLSDWVIVAKDNPPEDGTGNVETDAFAGSFIRDNADWASVHLGDSFWDESPEEQRVTLTHELIHCHLYRLHAFIGDRLKQTDRAAASSMEEIAIETLARIIAPTLPLPKVPAP